MKNGSVVVALAVAAAASPAFAGVVNPLVPAWRGSANTMYMGWENFMSAYAGANAADMAGSSNLASLFNFGPGAIVTGSGIYNPTGPLSIMIMGGVSSAPRNPTEVVMNLASMGLGFSDASVALTLFDNSGNSKRITPTSTSTRSSAPDGFGGTIATTAFSWTVDPLAWSTTRWQIDFSSIAPHVSLDAVTLDFKLVPAPGALAVLAAFVGGTSRGRRRSA
jgi:hypothetical protein